MRYLGRRTCLRKCATCCVHGPSHNMYNFNNFWLRVSQWPPDKYPSDQQSFKTQPENGVIPKEKKERKKKKTLFRPLVNCGLFRADAE